MGVGLFSAAIIISLLAMRARAPQWLLMFCGGWTLFTLVNVTWQPLMAFQLALIWGGYAFLAPRGLPQRKFWKFNLWESVQREGIKFAQVIYPEPRSPPLRMTTYGQPKTAPAESNPSAPAENRKRHRLNKTLIIHIFIVILGINILTHLIPFNYSSALVMDEIARSIGNTVAIYLVSLIGLIFKPNKTFGVALIAILITPIMILVDRAHDPVAPRYFRELLYPNDDLASGTLRPNVEPGNTESADNLAAIAGDAGNVDEQGIVEPAGQAILNQQSDKIPEISSQTVPTVGQFIDTIHRAVDKFSTILAKDGMVGAQIYSNDCRSTAMRSINIADTDYCIAFDVAAMSADLRIAESAGFPRNEYFISRASGIDGEYNRFNQSTEGRTEMIWKEVNSVLLTSIQSAHGGSE